MRSAQNALVQFQSGLLLAVLLHRRHVICLPKAFDVKCLSWPIECFGVERYGIWQTRGSDVIISL